MSLLNLTLFSKKRCKGNTFYRTMQYKVIKIMFFCVFYFILQSRDDKIGVKFAYMRKNVYLCTLFMCIRIKGLFVNK